MTDQKANWLFFGAASPDPRCVGGRFNVGGMAIDVLARIKQSKLIEAGFVKTTLVEMSGSSIRLVKPNVVPEIVDECLDVMEKRFIYSKGTVVCFYGDHDLAPGDLKIKTDTGASGNVVVSRFLKRFDPEVVRFRIGMGRPHKGRWNEKSEDLGETELGSAVVKCVQTAVRASSIMVQHGLSEAKAFAFLANKNKGHTWMPKS